MLAIITGNPLSNEKVNTLPENLLGILFEEPSTTIAARVHPFLVEAISAIARYSYTNLKASKGLYVQFSFFS